MAYQHREKQPITLTVSVCFFIPTPKRNTKIVCLLNSPSGANHSAPTSWTPFIHPLINWQLGSYINLAWKTSQQINLSHLTLSLRNSRIGKKLRLMRCASVCLDYASSTLQKSNEDMLVWEITLSVVEEM